MYRTAAVALTLAATLVTGGVLAVGGGAQTTSGQTIKLVTKNFHYAFVDNPPKARGRNGRPGIGDAIAFNAIATDAAGKRVGSLNAVITVTNGTSKGRGVGHAIYALPDGQIHALFLTTLAENDALTEVGSVVGGTGAYVGARGTVTSVDRKGTANGDPSDDTITVLP
ncbi:MAG: hypothetical protein H0T69_01095 [Thermoleophilaceae bacterium]|nr:hypothetical protein [Thermoleophilaceae bacterium]